MLFKRPSARVDGNDSRGMLPVRMHGAHHLSAARKGKGLPAGAVARNGEVGIRSDPRSNQPDREAGKTELDIASGKRAAIPLLIRKIAGVASATSPYPQHSNHAKHRNGTVS